MNNQEIRLLKKYTLPYKIKLISIAILTIIGAFFEAINIGSLVPLLQLLGGSDAPGGTLWSALSKGFSFIGLELNFFNLLAVIAILFIIGQVILFHKKKLQVQLWFTMSANMKNDIFNNLLESDVKYLYSQKTGQFNDLLTRESEYASQSVFALTEIVTFVFFIMVYSAMLLYISVEMTVICLVIALCTLLMLNSLIARSKTLGKTAIETSMGLNDFISERLNLMKLIKIFSTEQLERDQFGEITGQYAKNNSAFMLNGIKIETIFQIIIFFIALAILYISSSVLTMPLALLLVFIFILIRLTDPLRQFNAQRHQIAGQLSALEKIDAMLTASAGGKTLVNGSHLFAGLQKSIEFNNVSFSYTPQNRTLDNICFEIRKYDLVALVGVSGGGKSTIVDQLIHVLEPDGGSILIDGVDIREYDIGSYHRKIGFVSQESFLFNDTITRNICYGDTGCDIDQVKSVAKIANAHEFIENLHEGYDTVIGERGVKLSGGQKQRIALARALYKKPDILIMDEATSALDSESEKVIQEAITAIKHKYTMIVIAHRLSTIKNADFIVVIEKGKIAEKGTHDQLVSSGGPYSKYYNIQHNSEKQPDCNPHTLPENPLTG
jgi:subfamily B ATP-binding cassette protein MsbA